MFEQYTLPSWITDDYSDNFIKNQLAEEGVIAYSVDKARERDLDLFKQTQEIKIVED